MQKKRINTTEPNITNRCKKHTYIISFFKCISLYVTWISPNLPVLWDHYLECLNKSDLNPSREYWCPLWRFLRLWLFPLNNLFFCPSYTEFTKSFIFVLWWLVFSLYLVLTQTLVLALPEASCIESRCVNV